MLDHVTPPTPLREIDKATLDGMREVVRKVVCRATYEGVGYDLLLRVYLAGLYHGSQAQKDRQP